LLPLMKNCRLRRAGVSPFRKRGLERRLA